MLMVLIILMSFSNFIYVINVNLNHMYPDNSYYKKYTGVGVIDVVISVYMLGMLGDFESEVYITGYDRYYAIVMFLIATYLISVVFMNMLIAIMGETFTMVSETKLESGLME